MSGISGPGGSAHRRWIVAAREESFEHLPDPLRFGPQGRVVEVGIAKGHPGVRVSEEPRDDGNRDARENRVACERVPNIMYK